jgi:four helix bundle protein
MKTKKYRELQVWQHSMKLTRSVYAITLGFPRDEMFGLISQMRRAAVSIPSNIAEGHGHDSDKSSALYLTPARGSLCELETQLELACDLKMLNAASARTLMESTAEIGRMLNGLLRVLHSSDRVTRQPSHR